MYQSITISKICYKVKKKKKQNRGKLQNGMHVCFLCVYIYIHIYGYV